MQKKCYKVTQSEKHENTGKAGRKHEKLQNKLIMKHVRRLVPKL